MDIHEAYKAMQKECGVNVGDTVRVLTRAKSYHMGWNTCWMSEMDEMIGGEYEVLDISTCGNISLRHHASGNGYSFPFFVLELVRKGKRTIIIDGKEIKISEESFQELKRQLV